LEMPDAQAKPMHVGSCSTKANCDISAESLGYKANAVA
jgi:hypothetical protein